jgi:uncharacterized protein YbjT (DUF2867 family)
LILITGASGRVARRAAELLLARGVPLRLMSRRPDRARFPGTETLAGDFGQPQTLTPVFAGIDVAFIVSAQGKPGERALLHRNAFDAAAHASVRHVVYLSLKGASQTSLYPFCRDHQTSERFLADTGLAHTILRIAFYQDMFYDMVDHTGAVRTLGGSGAGAFISREDTAWAVAAAVEKIPSRVHDVTGPECVRIEDLIRRLSAISDTRLHEVVETAEDMRRRLRRAAKPAWMQDLEVGWFEAIDAGEQASVSPDYTNLVGRKPQSIEAYFEAFPDLLEASRRTRAANLSRQAIHSYPTRTARPSNVSVTRTDRHRIWSTLQG